MDDVRDFVGDKLLTPHMVDEIMKALEQNSEAAYLVYLKLAIKFGAGQKL